MNIDLSIQIKRNAENQNYQLNMLVINPRNTGVMETNICQTLAEVCEKIAQFEAKHLNVFEHAIEYEKTDWRQLARQNQQNAKRAAK
ncbi:hypothetical protein [Kingella sp. (in: b-proteobacteria)]|uniref:hypothetical protein n=1 Tax=Kingella sp. (in: b-proteobacteria) TaxID=2020713 RepID=UPI0026DD335D|nr:hypothetical protein [Kingella sp. (in: b-proteobacteria)]MDO4656320.1 hypothetical protein [Kingella sp. (in: b-proteobacteria)]